MARIFERTPVTYKKSFEENLLELETITGQMEDGLPLAETLEAYKKAQELLRFCELELDEAKRKIYIYDSKSDGLLEVNPESVRESGSKRSDSTT